MSLERIFYLLKEAESRSAGLYDAAALNVSLRLPQLAELFGQLAAEERVHERQVDHIHTLFRGAKDCFSITPHAEEILADFLELLQRLEAYVRESGAELARGDLLRLALELETTLVENHRTLAFTIQDPGLKKLAENLMRADEGHLQRIQAALAEK